MPLSKMESPEGSHDPAATIVDDILCYHPDRAHGCEDYPEDGFSSLIPVEDGHFWFESRNRILRSLIERHLPAGTATKKFLEIGCGTGFVLRMLAEIPGLDISGSEIYLSAAKIATSRAPKAKVFQLDVLRMEFHQEYDAIGLFDVLEHLDNDQEAIQRSRKALKENGMLFITVPQYPAFWSILDIHAGHKRRYTREDLENKVRRSGFQVRYVSSLFCSIFPLYAISRLRKQHLSAAENEKKLMSEFHISQLVNRALTTLCWFDLIAVRLGLRLPFGGSLILIAQA